MVLGQAATSEGCFWGRLAWMSSVIPKNKNGDVDFSTLHQKQNYSRGSAEKLWCFHAGISQWGAIVSGPCLLPFFQDKLPLFVSLPKFDRCVEPVERCRKLVPEECSDHNFRSSGEVWRWLGNAVMLGTEAEGRKKGLGLQKGKWWDFSGLRQRMVEE